MPKSFVAQRLKPALALAVGLALLALNLAYLILSDHFFVLLLYVGCVLTLSAAFGTVVGEPADIYGNRPTWFRVGIVVCIIVGVLVALMLHVELTAD